MLTDTKEILEPNPEQTASLLSLLSYNFIAPVIWLAYRMPHLPFDMFPPLPDYDHLRNIVGRSFPVSLPSVRCSRTTLIRDPPRSLTQYSTSHVALWRSSSSECSVSVK